MNARTNPSSSLRTVPQPTAYPLIGNVPNIDADTPVQSMMALSEEFGRVYRLTFPTTSILVVGEHAIVDELSDESRFEKAIHLPLQHLRDLGGDGLFTASTDDPKWGKAHRVLMPAFGPSAMRRYFADMVDVADQLVTKWDRLGPAVDHDVADAMTRLTLDTIALSGFGYRFNSYYQREMHPFVDAMVRSLAEAGARGRRLPIQSRLMIATRKRYERDLALMNDVVDGVIRERRSQPNDPSRPKDLLDLMLEGRDPETGEGLDDLNIRHQVVTFLIAGHETTSGLLSFAIHFLLKHPDVLARAVEEVDRVFGTDPSAPVDFAKISELRYLDQILKETLRIWPTAPAYAVKPFEDVVLGGRYPVRKGDTIIVLSPILHRDPAVWSDPERFDPDRFSPSNAGSIPSHAWKPFGNGQRACIGRAFAMQEALLVLGMLLQRFTLEDPHGYELVVKETLTLKPEGLRIRARTRERGARPASGFQKVAAVAKTAEASERAPTSVRGAHATPLLVLYGSNSGSSEDFAQRLGREATRRGYHVEIAPLDAHAGRLPRGPSAGAVLIVTASYNGQPPDNAKRFCQWLAALTPGSLEGVRYAVLGAGHRDWASTYQSVPRFVDERLAVAGAQRLSGRGEADAGGDFFGAFEGWSQQTFADADRTFGVEHAPRAAAPRYQIERVSPSPDPFEQLHGAQRMTVRENRELVDLSSPFGRSKRHVEIALPDGVSYRAGDYLAVLPEHDPELVLRAARRFGLDPNEHVVVRGTSDEPSALPVDRPVAVSVLLARYVELGAPATRENLRTLAANTPCPPEARQLLALADDDVAYRRDVLEPRIGVLALLERFASCALSFGAFLELLPPVKPRRYSISSSPLAGAGRCTLTVAVLDAPARSGEGRYRGACSNFLARLGEGDSFSAAVASPNTPFRLPDDASVPVIFVGAGSGIAPLRGFLEERASLHARAVALGPALLFFGCDHPDVDFLYRDELAAWEAAGVVRVFPAFFRAEEDGVTFVQHRLWRERLEVGALLERGARVFVCGDGQRMAPAVKETLARIHGEQSGASMAESLAWLASAESEGQLVTDVFSG